MMMKMMKNQLNKRAKLQVMNSRSFALKINHRCYAKATMVECWFD